MHLPYSEDQVCRPAEPFLVHEMNSKCPSLPDGGSAATSNASSSFSSLTGFEKEEGNRAQEKVWRGGVVSKSVTDTPGAPQLCVKWSRWEVQFLQQKGFYEMERAESSACLPAAFPLWNSYPLLELNWQRGDSRKEVERRSIPPHPHILSVLEIRPPSSG